MTTKKILILNLTTGFYLNVDDTEVLETEEAYDWGNEKDAKFMIENRAPKGIYRIDTVYIKN